MASKVASEAISTPNFVPGHELPPRVTSISELPPIPAPKLVRPRLIKKTALNSPELELEEHYTLMKNAANAEAAPAPVHLLKARFSRSPSPKSKHLREPCVMKKLHKKSLIANLEQRSRYVDQENEQTNDENSKKEAKR